ncbi:MAG TPA: hypothetical protein VE989_03415 [Sphingomicrobium sp.]|nr:hypothetical protein [Sphingomicrobium sp.]
MTSDADAAIEPSSNPAPRKSLWTSLETAKFVASLATPFALLALSILVANQQRQQEELSRNAVEQTQRSAEAAAQKREAAIRQDGKQFQKMLQDAALDRDTALRREGFAREKAMRDEAFRREEAVRQHQLELARVSKLADKRIEFWEKMAPKLDQIDVAIDDVLMKRGKPDQVSKLFRECENLFGLYKPYFSPKFVGDYLTYKQRIQDFIKLVNEVEAPSGAMYGLRAGDGALAACQSYVTLRDSAAFEVARATGLVDVTSGERSYQWAYINCEERQKQLQDDAVKAESSRSGG